MQRQTGGRTKAILFLVGSLVVASLTAVLVLQMLSRAREQVAEANRPPDTVDIVVAKRDLYIGLPITEEDIMVRAVTPEMVPNGLTFASLEEVVRRVPRERILAGEPLRSERLAQRDAGVGLNAIIASGKRAMTVETDTESGLAGLLQAGNFVDVIVTIRPDDADIQAKWLSETILQGIKVLAVGDALAGASRPAEGEAKEAGSAASRRRQRPSVTLELTLEEAEKLALASSKGDVHLVLRNDVDITQVTTNGPVTAASMIGFEPDEKEEEAKKVGASRPVARPAAPPADPETFRTEIIGDDRNQFETYDSNGNKIQQGRSRSGNR